MWRQLDQLIDSYLGQISLGDLLSGRLPTQLPQPAAPDISAGERTIGCSAARETER